jgi:hypothetical protein
VNPLKQWELSPMDLESITRRDDYSQAKDDMPAHTDANTSPWFVVEAEDKRNARLNMIHHLLPVGVPAVIEQRPGHRVRDEAFPHPVGGRLAGQALVTLGEPVTGLGWQHPSTCVVTPQGRSFSPALQREFATHTTSVGEIDAGHGPMLAKPAELAAAIAVAAG